MYKNKLNFGIINSSRGLCFIKSVNNCNDIKSWKKEIYKNLEEKYLKPTSINMKYKKEKFKYLGKENNLLSNPDHSVLDKHPNLI